jgi:hypothetical protein
MADGGVLSVSNNFTAHDIQLGNAKFVADKGSRFMPHNATSAIETTGSAALFEVFGTVETMVNIKYYGNVTVQAGGSVWTIWVGGGFVDVYGHVDSIMTTSSGCVIRVWGTVKSITGESSATIDVWGAVDQIAVYGGVTTIYKGASVTKVDPYGGEVHIYPGSNVDTIEASSGTSSSKVYFDNDMSSPNATDNQVNVKTVQIGHGGSIYIANNTQVSAAYWNSSSSSSTYFYGWDGAVFWIAPGSDCEFSTVYLQETVKVINSGKLIISGNYYYSLRLNDQSSLSNQATIQADSGIYVETYATFTNEMTGWIVSDIADDPSTTVYPCYFQGTYTSVDPSVDPSGYQYTRMYNWGNFACAYCTFDNINVDNYGNVSTPNFHLSSSSDYAFTYKKGSITQDIIYWTGSGYVVFEENHWVNNIQILDGATINIKSLGNTTIGTYNNSGSSLHLLSDPGQWIAFDGVFDSDGSEYFDGVSATFTGVITSRGNGFSWTLKESTVTFTEKSTMTDEGDSTSSPYWSIYDNSVIYFQGVVDIYTCTIYTYAGTAWWVNQGDWKSKSSVSFYNYYSDPDAGAGYNVGSMELTGASIDVSFGMCKAGVITIRDRDYDTYFYPYVTISGPWAMQAVWKFKVPSGFKDTVWDQSTQELVYWYQAPEDWDALDEVSAYTTDDIIPTGNILYLCLEDTSSYGYVYGYRSTKPTNCATAGTGGGSTICSRSDLPGASDPQGGTPGGPSTPAPGIAPTPTTVPAPTVPTMPTAPVPTMPTVPTTPTSPVPTTPTSPVPTGPKAPTTPVKPTPTTPTKPGSPTPPSSTAGTISFSVVFSLILSFYLFIMF